LAIPTTPALRYHGAKFRLYKWLKQFFPIHRCYVEPFGGAAGVMIQKPPAVQDVYNDLDGDIANFFTVVRDESTRARLIEALILTPYARAEFELAFTESSDTVERARRVCIRAQMGFGSAGATKGTTGFRVDTARKYSTSMDLWSRYPGTISKLGQRFSGVLVENRPALRVIQDHDSDDTLYFVDPPYLHSTRVSSGYAYGHEMSNADHQDLIAALGKLTGMVILCGYYSNLYSDMLSGWQAHSTDSRVSAHRGTRVAREIIWLNPACVAALGDSSQFRLT